MLNNTKSVLGLVLALALATILSGADVFAGDMSPWTVGGGSYDFRQEIIVSSALTASPLTGYPLLVQVTDPGNRVFSESVDGTDIVFTADDGVTQLSRDIETFTNTGTPELNAWVKTDISSTIDTKIYMYYNGPSSANSTDTWDGNYTLVQHLQEDPSGPLFDSTAFNNDGTNAGTVSAIGRIGAALEFDGSDTVNVGNDVSLFPTSLTLEAWAKGDAWVNWHGIFTTKTSANNGINLSMGINNRISSLVSGGSGGGLAYSQTASVPNTDQWYHIAITHNSADDKNMLYVDGTLVLTATTTQSLAYAATLPAAKIGSFYTGSLFFDGIIDEVRLSDTVRSADWIAAQALLVNNPGTYVTFGELVVPVPEPSSFLLLGLGAMGLVRHTRRRKASH